MKKYCLIRNLEYRLKIASENRNYDTGEDVEKGSGRCLEHHQYSLKLRMILIQTIAEGLTPPTCGSH